MTRNKNAGWALPTNSFGKTFFAFLVKKVVSWEDDHYNKPKVKTSWA
jgi:hypothetical protein